MSAPAFEISGYELIRELGAGGMATVFLARQRSLDRKVAIKVMRRGLSDENVEKRFLMEGRTMARLPHPNIVGVYDIVQNDSINYIAMEFLEGGMLSDKMREGLTLAEAISVVVQVAGALQYAHDNGIVHRDLKPSNIMYRDATTPVLTDFGIAKQQGGEAATRLTQTGMMIGTPTYMSPEQAQGDDLDGRSDQYALGVLFFEMLTGHAPFEGSTPIQVVLAHLNSPPPPLPAQFANFQPLMDRMLAKSRDQRYPDLKIFVKELKQLIAGSDALMQRLSIDSNQSASEQLRALGFSESQIHTGSGVSPSAWVSAQRSNAAANRQTGTGSGPGVRMGMPAPQRPARPAWLIPAAVALVLAIAGGGAWLALKKEAPLDPAMALLLNDQLAAVDRLIGEGKLVAADGDSAFTRLQAVMQLAERLGGDFPEGEKRRATIAQMLRERAEKALAAKNYLEAEARVGEALVVNLDDPQNLALQKKIAAAKVSGQRDQQIAELLQRATAAQRAGKLAGEGSDNALAAIREALNLDPGSADAKRQLLALATQLLQPAQRAFDGKRFDEAEQELMRTAPYLADEPSWQKLSGLIQGARGAAEQQRKLESLLNVARGQLQQGRIAEPPGDNTLESLQRIAEIDPANAAAAALRREAAESLSKQAKSAEQKGDFALALARYDQVLQAQPGDAAATASRTALEQRVGQQQAQISRGVADARTAIGKRDYYGDAGKSAYEALQRVLKLEPGNADARQLLADLPGYARTAAESLAKDGKLDEALALLKAAQAANPNDARIAQLASTLASQRSAAAVAQQRDSKLNELRGLMALRRMDVDTTRSIAAAIGELQKLDSNDAEARKYRDQLTSGIGKVLAAARYDQLAQIAAVIDLLKKQFGETSVDIVALSRQYSDRQTALEASERDRLAAMSGTLVINALPWANVESVVDQATGKSVTLTGERSTPLRLTLPEGNYRVTFKHPSVGRSVVQLATVKAKVEQSANASFPTLTSADYLKRAGYAN